MIIRSTRMIAERTSASLRLGLQVIQVVDSVLDTLFDSPFEDILSHENVQI
jgi:hypothetical protein